MLLLFFPFFKHILRLNWPIWIFGMRFCRKQLIQHLTLIHDSALPFLIFLFSFFFAGHMKRKHGDSGSHHSNFFFPFFDTCFWTCSGKGTGEFTEYGFSKVKYFNTMTKKTSLPGLKLNSTLLLWVGVGVAQGFGSTGCSSYCDGRWNLWSAGASLDDISPGRTAACCWTLLDASWKRNNRFSSTARQTPAGRDHRETPATVCIIVKVGEL